MYFSIGQVSRMLGLTSQALRFYESKGIISPHKAENGRRYYDDRAVSRLVSCRKYRALGYSINEIVEQFTDCTPESVARTLKEKQRELQEQIARLQAASDASAFYQQQITAIPEHLHKCTVQESPELLFFVNQRDDEIDLSLIDETLLWLNALPVARISAQYHPDILNPALPRRSIRKGLVIDPQYAKLYGLKGCRSTVLLPKTKCVYTVATIDGPGIAILREVPYLSKFLEEQGLTPSGDLFGRVIFVACSSGGKKAEVDHVQYVELWVPVA